MGQPFNAVEIEQSSDDQSYHGPAQTAARKAKFTDAAFSGDATNEQVDALSKATSPEATKKSYGVQGENAAGA